LTTDGQRPEDLVALRARVDFQKLLARLEAAQKD
jgi:hypothetical protein